MLNQGKYIISEFIKNAPSSPNLNSIISPSNIFILYNPNNPTDLLDQPILYSIDFLFKWLTSVLLR